jgi:hypothetical protein
MKKLKPKVIEHNLEQLHTIGNIVYRTSYINQGVAFLSPMDDHSEVGLYYCCIELKIDQDGNILK